MDHEHEEGFHCAVCDGEGSLEERMQAVRDNTVRLMDEYGIAVQGVGGGPGPSFTYSVGMYRLGQPEIIVFGLPFEYGLALLNDIYDRVKEGRGYADGEVVTDLIAGPAGAMKSAFKEVPTAVAEDYTTASFYHAWKEGVEIPQVLQLVWPDRKDNLPWEPGYDHDEFDKKQPQLWLRKN